MNYQVIKRKQFAQITRLCLEVIISAKTSAKASTAELNFIGQKSPILYSKIHQNTFQNQKNPFFVVLLKYFCKTAFHS